MRTLKLILATTMLAIAASSALAQYPTANPTYIPDAIVAPTTVSATGTAMILPANGLETVYVRIGGSPSSVVANMQGTESRDSSPTWNSLPVINMATGAQQSTITGTGLYRLNAAGLGQVSISTTTLTGTFTVAMSGGFGGTITRMSPAKRNTYTANVAAAAPAAAFTDLMMLPGNANNTVRLTAVECTGQGTTTSVVSLSLIKYSVASTGGTTTTTTIAKMDSLDPTAASQPLLYTANPTLGTSNGTLAVGRTIASTTLTPTALSPIVWTFGNRNTHEQEVTLRGATETVAINGAGATVQSGTTINCSMTWTEE